jgi:type IV pilus assembly protein PilC
MAQFFYHALNRQHERVSGSIAADSLSQAIVQLESQGLTVQSIADEQSNSGIIQATLSARGEQGENPFESPEQHALQRERLASLLDRAKILLPPLRAFAQEQRSRKRQQLQTVIDCIASGNADAATRIMDQLPGYWIPLLGSAAASRNPSRVLHEFLAESQRAEELQRQRRKAYGYPLVLICVATSILVGLSILYVPIFRNIYQDFGIRIPSITWAVFEVAEWIISGKLLVSLLALVLGIVVIRMALYKLLPRLWEWGEDRLTFWSGHSVAIARFSQFAADLLDAGLPPNDVLRLASKATGNRALARAATRVAVASEGNPELWASLNSRLLTHSVRAALTNALPHETRMQLLRELSLNHSERIEAKLSWTRGLIEPISIMVIGLVVGATVFALFMPLIQLVNALS